MVLTLDDPATALRALSMPLSEIAEPWVLLGRRAIEVVEPERGPGLNQPSGAIHDESTGALVVHLTWAKRSDSPTKIANAAVEVFPDDEARRLAHYAIVELLRNGTSHSQRSGAWLAVTRGDFNAVSGGKVPVNNVVQVCVVDTGIGVLAALSGFHPGLTDAREAIEKSMWPHYSGTFEEGLTGSGENAGLGLFFISEMTKLIAGRLLIATRGAALLLTGDPDAEGRNREEFIDAEFPGTLVVFEIPVESVHSFDGIMDRIRALAVERAPKRTSARWLKFTEPTGPIASFRIDPNEMAPETRAFAERELESRAFKRESFVLDFAECCM